MKIKVDVEAENFYRQLERALKASKKEATYIIKEASKFFIQSATKATQPSIGRPIAKKLYKRTMTNIRGFHFKDGGTGWRKEGERKKKGDFVLWKVLYKNSTGKGAKFYKDKSEAQAFQRIKYRGIGRAGWSISLSKLGFGFPADLSADVQALAGQINDVKSSLNVDNPSVEITNKVRTIQRHSPLSAKIGLGKAANRVKAITRQIQKRIEQEGNR